MRRQANWRRSQFLRSDSREAMRSVASATKRAPPSLMSCITIFPGEASCLRKTRKLKRWENIRPGLVVPGRGFPALAPGAIPASISLRIRAHSGDGGSDFSLFTSPCFLCWRDSRWSHIWQEASVGASARMNAATSTSTISAGSVRRPESREVRGCRGSPC